MTESYTEVNYLCPHLTTTVLTKLRPQRPPLLEEPKDPHPAHCPERWKCQGTNELISSFPSTVLSHTWSLTFLQSLGAPHFDPVGHCRPTHTISQVTTTVQGQRVALPVCGRHEQGSCRGSGASVRVCTLTCCADRHRGAYRRSKKLNGSLPGDSGGFQCYATGT